MTMPVYKKIGPKDKEVGPVKRYSWALTFLVLLVGGAATVATYSHYTKHEYHNKHDIVHVVETDFLQYQLDLKHLNRARLDLFETFTVPSMRQQSTKEFLWLIWTDPSLSEEFKDLLKEKLKGIHNVIVLAHRRDRKMDFRDLNGLSEKEIEKDLVYGCKHLLKTYHEASKNNLLLETRLDADDALRKDFIESIQQQASTTIAQSDLKTDYRIFCPEHHTEWRYYKPEQEEDENGFLVHYHNPSFCINTGLTIGYQTDAKARHLNTLEQCNMNQWYEECVAQGYEGVEMEVIEGTPYIHHFCVNRARMLREKDQAVLMSRTPTTAGMKRVLGTEKTFKSTFDSVTAQQDAWKMIESDFGVKMEQVLKVRESMENNMHNILQDALEGQCMPGHSCKSATKRKLLKLLAKVQEKNARKAKETGSKEVTEEDIKQPAAKNPKPSLKKAMRAMIQIRT